MSKAFPSEVMMQKKVFITGAGGFTGFYLCKLLQAKGHKVISFGRGSHPSIENIKGDLLDKEILRKAVESANPDWVVNLAAIAFVGHGDIEDIYKTNICGTRNLLEALASLDKKPESILLASSANIYGNTCLSPIDESATPSPENDYAVSKLAMEYMANLWKDKLTITIVRPFNYTGLGQTEKFLLPKIVSHFRRNAKEIELGNIDVARDFSDVRTVVDAYARLLETRKSDGGVFNICSGKSYKLVEVIDIMQKIAGYKIKITINPAFVRNNEVKVLCGSNKKLVETIGSLEEYSLADTLEWMYKE